MKSDRSFKDFLSSSLPLGKAGAILVFALILIAASFLLSDKGEEKVQSDDISALCSEIDGVGECRVTLSYDEQGGVIGVAVICEGAESASVRAGVVDFFSSLYGIGANRITVLKIRNKN